MARPLAEIEADMEKARAAVDRGDPGALPWDADLQIEHTRARMGLDSPDEVETPETSAPKKKAAAKRSKSS